MDDEELTQDLTIPDRLPKVDPPLPDRADFEVTQLVQTAPPAQERVDRGREDSGSHREHSWPTAWDAPPPPVARTAHQSIIGPTRSVVACPATVAGAGWR